MTASKPVEKGTSPATVRRPAPCVWQAVGALALAVASLAAVFATPGSCATGHGNVLSARPVPLCLAPIRVDAGPRRLDDLLAAWPLR